MTAELPGLRHLDPAAGTLDGLAGATAAVRLPAVPTAAAAPVSEPVDLGSGPVVTGAGASSGDVYVPDPGGHRVIRWTACDGTVGPIACFDGSDADGGAGIDAPVAVAITRSDRLYVADAGRGAIVVVDASTGQRIDEWDVGPASPIAIAIDAGERAYVGFETPPAPPDTPTLRRFDRAGREDPTFAIGGAAIQRPVAVLVTAAGPADAERLVVLDARAAGPPRLRAFDLDGSPAADVASLPTDLPPGAAAVAVVGGRFFVAGSDAVIAYDESGGRIGPVADLTGAVRALAVDCHGHLLALAGAPPRLMRVVAGTTWTTSGSFTVFIDLDQDVEWHHLDLLDVSIPPRTHVRLFTCSTAADVAAPTLDGDPVPANALVPAGPGRWRAHPVDASTMRLLVAPGSRLSVTGRLEGDGSATPTVGLIRVAFDRPSWLRFLPAIYERDALTTPPTLADPDADEVAVRRAQAAFLERALAFLERSVDESSERIDDLPILFDAMAAPDASAGSAGWLDWLAGWLALDLDATWASPKRRAAVAAEFELAGIRGTARGLARLIERDTGVVPIIDEPAARAVSWSLGQTSVLGFTTMVAPAEAAGAVLDTTAIVNGSHLIEDDDYGSPLYEDLVGRVCVRIRPAADRAAVERRVRALLDVELPAHAAYHLCVTDAAMRVGAQSQVGIDSIVAGPPPDLVADGTLRLGYETVLPAVSGTHISLGTGARVGHDAVVQ